MHGLDQRRLAHAACAPEQCIVGWQSARESIGVFDQHVAHLVYSLEERHVDAIDFGHRNETPPVGMPGERLRQLIRRRPRHIGRESFQRQRNTLQRLPRTGEGASAGVWCRLADAVGHVDVIYCAIVCRRLNQPGAGLQVRARRGHICWQNRRQRRIAIERLAAIVRADFASRNQRRPRVKVRNPKDKGTRECL